MTTFQKATLMFSVVMAICLASTVFVLILDRLFPGARYVTIGGPFICVGAVIIFNKFCRDSRAGRMRGKERIFW